jgi:SAM-dependent methyltransferase
LRYRAQYRMNQPLEVNPRADLDWAAWVARWDRMQARYLPLRDARFALLVRLVRAMQPQPAHLLDLGCGTGSLTLALLEAFPHAEVWGLDLDPTLLALARARLAGFGARVHLVEADLRTPAWQVALPHRVEGVVSATALHWLTIEQLARLYGELARALRPGGVFLNADHVGSSSGAITDAWKAQRDDLLAREGQAQADDWDSFWEAYGRALGPDVVAERQRLLGPWVGSEEGLPLTWHLDQLRAQGFVGVDCFWRLAGDAIYGGLRG